MLNSGTAVTKRAPLSASHDNCRVISSVRFQGRIRDIALRQLADAVGRQDGNVASGQELSLLGGRGIENDGKQVAPHPGIVQQRVALGRSAVGDHALALALGIDQKLQKPILDGVGPGLERGIEAVVVDPAVEFLGAQPLHRRCHVMGGLAQAAVDAQAPAMGREFLDVEDPEARGLENALHGEKRKIGVMLVIGGIELAVLDHPQEMRKLKRQYTLGLEKCRQATREIIDVGDMGIDVVAADQIGATPRGRQFTGQLFAEEGAQRGHADRLGRVRRAVGWFDPETGHPCFRRNSSEDTVIGSDLDHETL
jgi:hypothetical protein